VVLFLNSYDLATVIYLLLGFEPVTSLVRPCKAISGQIQHYPIANCDFNALPSVSVS